MRRGENSPVWSAHLRRPSTWLVLMRAFSPLSHALGCARQRCKVRQDTIIYLVLSLHQNRVHRAAPALQQDSLRSADGARSTRQAWQMDHCQRVCLCTICAHSLSFRAGARLGAHTSPTEAPIMASRPCLIQEGATHLNPAGLCSGLPTPFSHQARFSPACASCSRSEQPRLRRPARAGHAAPRTASALWMTRE